MKSPWVEFPSGIQHREEFHPGWRLSINTKINDMCGEYPKKFLSIMHWLEILSDIKLLNS